MIEDGERNAVFRTTAGVEQFKFRVDSTFGKGREMGEEDQWGIANGGLEAIASWSHGRIISVTERVIFESLFALGDIGNDCGSFACE